MDAWHDFPCWPFISHGRERLLRVGKDPSSACTSRLNLPWQCPFPEDPEASPKATSQVPLIVMAGGHTNTSPDNGNHSAICQLWSACCMLGPLIPPDNAVKKVLLLYPFSQ